MWSASRTACNCFIITASVWQHFAQPFVSWFPPHRHVFSRCTQKDVLARQRRRHCPLDTAAAHTISAATHHIARGLLHVRGFHVRGNARDVYSRGELIVSNAIHRQARPWQYLRREARGVRGSNLTAERVFFAVNFPREVPVDHRRSIAFQPQPGSQPWPAQRHLGTYNYIALWFSMSMEITTYQLASSSSPRGRTGNRPGPHRCCWAIFNRTGPHAAQRPRGRKVRHSVSCLHSRPFGVRGANLPAILPCRCSLRMFGIQS